MNARRTGICREGRRGYRTDPAPSLFDLLKAFDVTGLRIGAAGGQPLRAAGGGA